MLFAWDISDYFFFKMNTKMPPITTTAATMQMMVNAENGA